MTTIKVKRIYDPPEKADGFRILVDRLWPRHLKKEKAALDLWLKEIAPSNELRRWFNHEAEKWDEFQTRYTEELASNPELVKDLIQKIKQNSVTTLLFSAKETEHNNAVALRKFMLQKL